VSEIEKIKKEYKGMVKFKWFVDIYWNNKQVNYKKQKNYLTIWSG
jgi:hypothetical protein